jgi:haloacetate dehalogenase
MFTRMSDLSRYPQTRYIYHKIADELVEQHGFTVIIPDLRGYGRSSKPRGSKSHAEYSKREMASDIVQLAQHFGYTEFGLIAHDRGGRVAHRLCLDHPQAVRKLIILDICPTLFMYETTDREFVSGQAGEGSVQLWLNVLTLSKATKYWHWIS